MVKLKIKTNPFELAAGQSLGSGTAEETIGPEFKRGCKRPRPEDRENLLDIDLGDPMEDNPFIGEDSVRLEHKAKSIASQNLGTINADPDLINMTINEIKTGNPLSNTQHEYLKNNLIKIGEDPGLIEKMSSSEKIKLYSSYREVDKILDKYSESFDDCPIA